MQVPWQEIFDNFGLKMVSDTDKSRSAYLPNAAQKVAIAAADIHPADTRPGVPFPVNIFFDSTISVVESSFYLSKRSEGADRSPESRMGQEFIRSWANRGDYIVIGNIGSQLFAAKVGNASAQALGEVLVSAGKTTLADVIAKAKQATGKPKTVLRKQAAFVRNPYVVAAALIRADGRCELPGCNTKLFEKDDGTLFLEVHHIIPLAEDGVDELANAAAQCPMCHRELHLGKSRYDKRATLGAVVATKNI